MSSSRHSIPSFDRISDLPDSKRWERLGLSVVELDFNTRNFITRSDFQREIYKTLYQRDSRPIHSFRLKYHKRSFCEQHDVNQFVFHVLKRGIQIFCLNLSVGCCYLVALPITIFSCRTLKVLELTNIVVGDISREDFHLPSLITLHLNNLNFESYRDLVNLLLSCPLLEDLRTTGCFADKDLGDRFKGDFIIVLPNLIKARIAELYIPLCMVSKAQILCVQDLGMLTCCTKLPMFHNLTHLELNFKSKLWFPKWTWLFGMLKLSPKLQNFIIKDNDNLEEADDECWEDLSIVPECLLSQLKTCHFRNYKDKKYDLEFAKYIIENSKVLDTMTINSTCSPDAKAKYQGILSSCKRGSTTCELLFD